VSPAGASAHELAERAAIEGIDAIVPFAVPLTQRFRGLIERQGLLLHGPSGWGEWSPFDEYPDRVASVWLDAAIAASSTPPPAARRDRVAVNAIVPAVDAVTARSIVETAGCSTAKVKVAEVGQSLAEDAARLSAVREALGPGGSIRIDANASWTAEQAIEAVGRLEDAAGGLEYVEQPCATLAELAEVRMRCGIRIAADESIRRDHEDPVLLRDAVDVAVIKVQPSGGVAEALRLAGSIGLPVVVSSALETSIGLAAGLRLAAALSELPYACGLATGHLLAEDVVLDPLLPIDGELHSVDAAGLELRGDVPFPSPERLEWWLSRLARARSVRVGGGDAS
jgi:O-succinylbenzoate synthase